MRISTKGRYSLLLLLDLAEHQNEGYVPLKDIAKRQGISKKYLEQLVNIITASGLIRANRGNQGGYMLVKPPHQYKVGQILKLTEGSFCMVDCLENEQNLCKKRDQCKTLFIWKGMQQALNDYLNSITLQTILDNHNGGGEYVYFI